MRVLARPQRNSNRPVFAEVEISREMSNYNEFRGPNSGILRMDMELHWDAVLPGSYEQNRYTFTLPPFASGIIGSRAVK
jgi:hypothetical protein